MKVSDLIEKLQQLDPETHVFTYNTQGGVDDICSSMDVCDVALNALSGVYQGDHEILTDDEDKERYSGYTQVKGVVL